MQHATPTYGGNVKKAICTVFLLFSVSIALSKAQTPQQEFTDPMVLLQAVARNYAEAADTFRLASITDFETANELNHQWSRTYRTAIKGPGSLYRIEVRTGFGSLLQVSDGVNEWVYQVESNSYVKRPLPPDWPKFPKIKDMMFHELSQAWTQRTFLEDEALGYKRAAMLPEETIIIDGLRFPCYVVRASSDDSIHDQTKEYRAEITFWIDKQALVFRRIRRISDAHMMVSRNLRLPSHSETTETYPLAEIDPQTTPEAFRFTPPADAKEVATLEPDFGGPLPSPHPKAQMVGQVTPEITFKGPDGKKVELSSFRGKPLLIDFWATWCGGCLLSMPAVNRIYSEAKDKGLAVISFDENETANDATLYLARHHYGWTNFHDESKTVENAFKGEGIPLTVLIDSQGKVVYYDFGGDDAALRKAIAALGPEFVSIAPTDVKSSAAPDAGPRPKTPTH